MKFFKFFDLRDLFVLIGFILFFEGIREYYGISISMMVIGGLILIKGLKPWV
jgi:hypothetical protein